jgi:hypothetical protein
MCAEQPVLGFVGVVEGSDSARKLVGACDDLNGLPGGPSVIGPPKRAAVGAWDGPTI